MYIWVALSSFCLVLILGAIAVKIFPKLGLMDRPANYGLKRKPIPYYGGLVLFFAFAVSVLLFVELDKAVVGLLCSSFLIALVGFFDDKLDLHPLIRMFFQIIAGAILVLSGVYILSINLPLVGDLDFTGIVVFGIPLVGALFTVFWVMMILNSMNFLDGVSGLNSSVTFIAGLTLFFLSIHPGLHENPASQEHVAMLALIISMVSLGFLIFDFPKPRILMGDTGSTFLGFVLATLAIFSGGKVATAFLVLGIPILDMVWVVLRRTFWEKRPFWKGDLRHLHHRLLDLGVSDRKVVILYMIVSAIFGGSAIALVSTNQKFFMIVALVVLMVLLAGALILIPRKR